MAAQGDCLACSRCTAAALMYDNTALTFKVAPEEHANEMYGHAVDVLHEKSVAFYITAQR